MANRREKFIEKAKKVHGDKYDYSLVEYVDSCTKVKIVCPIHGEFMQAPSAHVRGNNCPLCANVKRGDTFRSNGEEFIDRAKKIHGYKYDYSLVEYEGADKKVRIICPKHGEFEIRPMSHLLGVGCPKCNGRSLTTEEIIGLFRETHGDRYDYSKVEYHKMHEKVCITCPKHGDFWQTPSKHKNGRGCPQCAIESRTEKHRVTQEQFIERANKVHQGKFDYSEVKFEEMDKKVKIICPKHGPFYIRPYDHVNGHACPRCAITQSKAEDEIYKHICEKMGSDCIERGNRSILDGFEIDIFVPSLGIGIEYNGLKWHSSEFKDKDYHLRKLEEANKKGVRLIQIFEDEYLTKKDIVLSKIDRVLGFDNTLPKIYARKCSVEIIDKTVAKDFLEKNHIQGYKGCSVSYGCIYNGDVVSVMTFEKRGDIWVLNRFASSINHLCIGVGGKLLTRFIDDYKPSEIVSFADRRWTINEDNNLYTKLGFILDKKLRPEYRYVNCNNCNERIHKFNFRKNNIAKKFGIEVTGKTESEITSELGFEKIYDCGLLRYKKRLLQE